MSMAPARPDRGESRPVRRFLTRLAWVPLAAALSLITDPGGAESFRQFPPAAGPLPQTTPLEWPEEDLSARMMDGAHRFVEAEIAATRARSSRFWQYERSSPAAWNQSIDANRARLREIIGVVESRVPAIVERYGDDDNPALVAAAERYRVYQVRWPVLDGISAEGLLVEPVNRTPSAHVVVVPDAGQTPEDVLGLTSALPRER